MRELCAWNRECEWLSLILLQVAVDRKVPILDMAMTFPCQVPSFLVLKLTLRHPLRNSTPVRVVRVRLGSGVYMEAI